MFSAGISVVISRMGALIHTPKAIRSEAIDFVAALRGRQSEQNAHMK
jgi:hypothetical protein